MPIAFWREDYETGHPQIDEQHQKLFLLINTLHDAMLKGVGKEFLAPTVHELKIYTIEHFLTEERIMKAYGYPDYVLHQEKHEELKKKVIYLSQDLQVNFLTIKISHFLTEWLIHHIKGEDQKMIRFLAPLLKKSS